jgi:uracil-DNA glycosylase
MDKPENSAEEYLPLRKSIPAMRKAAQNCQGCQLYKNATQAVFGRGDERATVMFVGEQPGDVEDRNGKAFSGPSGNLLMDALKDAGIDPAAAYFTNAVKHFGFQERGKRRLHKKPRILDIRACRPWLQAEIITVKPAVIVCLGSSATVSVAGKSYKVTEMRGKFIATELAPKVMLTVHPASILRARPEDRELQRKLFVNDLKKVAKYLRSMGEKT